MKPITIIGGGLAGLTLGILLRRENVPVTIYEAGRYPRHRVCGEFISGHGREILLSLNPKFKSARTAISATFVLRGYAPLSLNLREPALCISRYELDAALASQFENSSGTLHSHERFTGDLNGEGVIRATGRRRAEPNGAHLYGLKAHAIHTPLSSDLELHFDRNHYVGVCRLDENRLNVCGLFSSRKPAKQIQTEWPSILGDASSLKSPSWDRESFCSVAGLTMERPSQLDGFAIGDAAAMIPPLTGNGMSMAFESAAQALPRVLGYTSGRTSWAETRDHYFQDWKGQFARRLKWAAFIQRLIFQPAAQRAMLLTARAWPRFLDSLFARTR